MSRRLMVATWNRNFVMILFVKSSSTFSFYVRKLVQDSQEYIIIWLQLGACAVLRLAECSGHGSVFYQALSREALIYDA